MTVQQLQEKIAANARAWHETEDPEEKKRLHAESVELHGKLDGQTGSRSSFDAESGRWTTTAPGEGTYESGAVPQTRDMSDMVAARQEAATQRAVKALERGKAQGLAQLDEEEAGIDPAYTAAKNQTGAQNEIEKKNGWESAQASGLSSGAAGQMALAQSVAYQQAMNDLELQERQAHEKIDRDRSRMVEDYAYAVAEAKAEGDYALADALYQEAVRYDAAERERWIAQDEKDRDTYRMARDAARYNTQLQLQQEQRDYDRAQDDWEHRYKEAVLAQDKEQDLWTREQAEQKAAWDREATLWQQQRLSANDAWKRQRDLVAESQNAQKIALSQAAAQAKQKGSSGDFSGYGTLGYSGGQVNTMAQLWKTYMHSNK